MSAEEVDYDEDVEMNDTLQVSVSAGEKGPASSRKVTMTSKGRGHDKKEGGDNRIEGRGGVFEKLQRGGGAGAGPIESIEGWILFVTNVHQEAQEDDLLDKFSEFGTVKNIHVNLDRRSGFVKGYALVEFGEYDDALSAIKGLNGQQLLEQVINVDWAFVKK